MAKNWLFSAPWQPWRMASSLLLTVLFSQGTKGLTPWIFFFGGGYVCHSLWSWYRFSLWKSKFTDHIPVLKCGVITASTFTAFLWSYLCMYHMTMREIGFGDSLSKQQTIEVVCKVQEYVLISLLRNRLFYIGTANTKMECNLFLFQGALVLFFLKLFVFVN